MRAAFQTNMTPKLLRLGREPINREASLCGGAKVCAHNYADGAQAPGRGQHSPLVLALLWQIFCVGGILRIPKSGFARFMRGRLLEGPAMNRDWQVDLEQWLESFAKACAISVSSTSRQGPIRPRQMAR